MFCKDCGAELVNDTCPNCAPNTEAAEETVLEPSYVSAEKPKKKNLVLAIICMATGIASIIWGLGIIGGIAALITGSIYKKQNGESHTMVKVGTACGVIGIIIWVLAIALLLIYYVVYFLFLLAVFLLPAFAN